MTDLEMTKLCAKAMGWRPAGERKDFDTVKAIPVEQFPGAPHYQYAPLNDNSAAMALVKRFELALTYCRSGSNPSEWFVSQSHSQLESTTTVNRNLNRAIVECVAKIQKSKP